MAEEVRRGQGLIDAEKEEQERSPIQLISRFFLFPLIIVMVGVGIFVVFGLIGSDTKSAKDYLSELKRGGGLLQDNQRWQAALGLASLLRKDNDKKLAREITPEVINVFNSSSKGDPRVRQYLALALGRLGDLRAVPALVQALNDGNSQTQIYSMIALGELQTKEAVPDLMKAFETDDPDVRKVAVYVLGITRDDRALPLLKRALDDAHDDVRWNAALSLARFGDKSGVGVLTSMLDRSYLGRIKDMREDQREEAMVSAVSALATLNEKSVEPALQSLSKNDPSMKVRGAAFEALRNLK